MRNIFWAMCPVVLLFMFFLSCKKQNTVQSLEVKPMLSKSDEYFANLRAYKKSNHQLFFGWFGGIGVAGNSKVAGVLDNIPDSVDIVSLWGGLPPLGSYNHSLMKDIREKKGTKFVHVFFPNYFDEFKFQKNEDGVKLFADTLLKINKLWSLDGIDIDYESHVLSIFSNDKYMELLVSELGKQMGPKSNTEKLLIIDSFREAVPKNTLSYLSYYALQNYSPQGGTVGGIQGRLNAQVNGFPISKCIVTENFEDLWKSGGELLGFAGWNPQGSKKGGAGAYHAEYEYGSTPDYKCVRRAIQIMNPAVK